METKKDSEVEKSEDLVQEVNVGELVKSGGSSQRGDYCLFCRHSLVGMFTEGIRAMCFFLRFFALGIFRRFRELIPRKLPLR